jgi:hypothetical protein
MTGGQDRASCFAGTREQLLTDIKAWIHGSDTEKPIYVLYGIAGIGKTTVAQTVAEYAAEHKLLGASFFFSRAEEERKTGNHFFPTLAFQLAFYDAKLGTHSASAMRAAPDLPQTTLRNQIKYLLLDPIQKSQTPDHPVILVVDALDECVPTHAVTILQLLAKNIQSMPNFKIFITTRPEAHIERVLSTQGLLQPFYLHEIEKSIAKGDIQLFLDYALSKEQIVAALPHTKWEPTKSELIVLGDKCGILFIMATTAVRYILESNSPSAQMNQLLKGLDIEDGEEGVMSSLDKMYLGILQSSLPKRSRESDQYLHNFQTVVGAIIVLENPPTVSALANFLSMDESDVKITLQHLHSIMAPTSSNQAPQLYHKSFPDFITNNQRCVDTRFYIMPEEHHAQAAQYCFEIMDKSLHRNMYGLQGLQKFMKNSEVEVDGDKSITDEVVYACLHWANHCSKSGRQQATELLRLLEKFAFTHMLHWIEVLSLIGKLNIAYPVMKLAQNVLVSLSVSYIIIELKPCCSNNWESKNHHN